MNMRFCCAGLGLSFHPFSPYFSIPFYFLFSRLASKHSPAVVSVDKAHEGEGARFIGDSIRLIYPINLGRSRACIFSISVPQAQQTARLMPKNANGAPWGIPNHCS
jgi:hypothetical protein